MPVPRVAADGTVLVSWLDYDVWQGGQGTIYLDKSTDGGATWGTDLVVATITVPPINVHDINGATDARAKGAPVLATSPTSANDLYMVYAADPVDPPGAPPLGDEADIFFIKSTDQGVNWSSPLRLNTDLTFNDQILPWIDVKPDGTIDVAWYDRRNDPLDQLWDVYVTRSIDGGASFLPEFPINNASFLTPTGTWMGEYLGLVVDNGYGFVAWSSSATEFGGDIYFDSFANAAGPIIPEPATWLLLTLGTTGALAASARRRRRSARG